MVVVVVSSIKGEAAKQGNNSECLFESERQNHSFQPLVLSPSSLACSPPEPRRLPRDVAADKSYRGTRVLDCQQATHTHIHSLTLTQDARYSVTHTKRQTTRPKKAKRFPSFLLLLQSPLLSFLLLSTLMTRALLLHHQHQLS